MLKISVMDILQKQKVTELKALAKSLKIKNFSSMKKANLVETIFIKQTNLARSSNDVSCSLIKEFEKLSLKTPNIKGFMYRLHHLPNSIYLIKKILDTHKFKVSTKGDDGRWNSCDDEKTIISLLQKEIPKNRLYIPPPRHWFDIAILDYKLGWLPINLKSSTTLTPDNTGNLAMLAWAVTNHEMDIQKSYRNGTLAPIVVSKIKEQCYSNRDYYFVVICKNSLEIIVNSLKGLSKIHANVNNLPFQVKWCENKKFKFQSTKTIVDKIVKAITIPKPSWKETFLQEMRDISIS